jgi:hypothetical protein
MARFFLYLCLAEVLQSISTSHHLHTVAVHQYISPSSHCCIPSVHHTIFTLLQYITVSSHCCSPSVHHSIFTLLHYDAVVAIGVQKPSTNNRWQKSDFSLSLEPPQSYDLILTATHNYWMIRAMSMKGCVGVRGGGCVIPCHLVDTWLSNCMVSHHRKQ